MMTRVLAGAELPITAMARVIVLKLQLGVGFPPASPLPVAVWSFPLTGSTKYLLPVADAHWLQLWPMQAHPVPKLPLFTQSVSLQQLPATHTLPQQKSAVLAAQVVLLMVQAALAHLPWLGPADVVHMSELP